LQQKSQIKRIEDIRLCMFPIFEIQHYYLLVFDTHYKTVFIVDSIHRAAKFYEQLIDFIGSIISELACFKVRVVQTNPEQVNYNDCGLALCLNVRAIMQFPRLIWQDRHFRRNDGQVDWGYFLDQKSEQSRILFSMELYYSKLNSETISPLVCASSSGLVSAKPKQKYEEALKKKRKMIVAAKLQEKKVVKTEKRTFGTASKDGPERNDVKPAARDLTWD
jgi:Ulp1 family protease